MKLVSSALVFLMLLSGCTNNNSNQNADNQDSQVIVLDAKSGLLTGTANFGVFAHNTTSTKLVTFTLKNDGTEALTGPATLDQLDQGFSISYTNCPESLAIKRTCTLKVVFDPRSLSGGSYAANLNFDSVFVALSAIKEVAPEPENVTLVGKAQFQISNSVVTAVDFGELAPKDSVIKTITLKNVGTAPLTAQTVSLTGTDFVLSYDACSGKTIAKKGSCTLKISLAGAGKEGDISSTLSFGDLTASLTGKVITPAIAAQNPESNLKPNVVLMDGTSLAGASKDIGSFSGAQSVIVNLSAKNIGNLAAVADTASLSDATNFLLSYNQCSNKALAINGTCSMKVTFSASGKSAGSYSTILSFGGQVITLQATVTAVAPTCGDGYELVGNECQPLGGGTLMARLYTKVLDSQDNTPIHILPYNTVLYHSNGTALVVMTENVAPYRNYLYKLSKNSNDEVVATKLRAATFSSPTNATGNYFQLMSNNYIFNRPIGNYAYFTELVNSSGSSRKVFQVNIDSGAVEDIFVLPNVGGIYALDIQNGLALIQSSSTSAGTYLVVDNTGNTVITFNSNKMYTKGLTLSSSYTSGYLNPSVVFNGGRIYFQARPTCSSRPATLYYCDVDSGSANSCDGETTPFVKILGADQGDPSVSGSNNGAGPNCSYQWKPVALKGNKIFYEGGSIEFNYSALYSYNITNGNVVREAFSNAYLYPPDLNTPVKYNGTYNYAYSVGYKYDGILSGNNIMTYEKRPLNSGYNYTDNIKMFLITNSGSVVLLEDYNPYDLMDPAIHDGFAQSYALTTLVTNSIWGSGLGAQVGVDNPYYYYLRKSSLSPSELISGNIYYDEWGTYAEINPYRQQLVRVDKNTGTKLVSQELFLGIYEQPLQQVGDNDILVTKLYSDIGQYSLGPVLSFDEQLGTTTVKIPAANVSSPVYGNPSLYIAGIPLYNLKTAINSVETNSGLYYLSEAQPVLAGLEWLDPSYNSANINITWSTTKLSSFYLTGSRLTTSEGYTMSFSANNSSVTFVPSSNMSYNTSNAGMGLSNQINYSNWNGQPINLNVVYTTVDTNQTKSFNTTLNINCASGASFDENLQCVCSDNNKYYSGTYCANKCTGGVWNDGVNTCVCDDPSYTYQPGSGPNGSGGYCTAPVSCDDPWNIWDPYDCGNCGYYWDDWMYQCMW